MILQKSGCSMSNDLLVNHFLLGFDEKVLVETLTPIASEKKLTGSWKTLIEVYKDVVKLLKPKKDVLNFLKTNLRIPPEEKLNFLSNTMIKSRRNICDFVKNLDIPRKFVAHIFVKRRK